MSAKTYNLVAVLEKNRIFREKSKTEILCIDCCGKNLYIGTDDSFIIHFLLEEKVGENAKVYFHCDRQEHKSSLVESRKPVTQVKAVSALNRILAITDSVLQLLNMFDLEPLPNSPKIKGVTCFALNENPINDSPFGIEVCLALKKRCIQVVAIKEDRIVVNWELPVADTPVAVSMDGALVCAASTTEYKMWQIKTGHLQDLFPFDGEQMTPIITKISKEEVLLSAPGLLGMFANSSGVSQRPPLQWNRRLVGMAYAHPYIVALDDEFITVHSILDQQQKQTFAFHGGQCIGDYDGRMLVASRRDIYALCSIPFEKQVQELLSASRVTEALLLAKNTRKTGMSKEAFNKMFKRIQLQAGFVELTHGHLDEARELFTSGQLDLRELISLFLDLLPPASRFTRVVPPLHEIPDIGHITRGDEAKTRTYSDFMLDLLLEHSADITDDAYRKDVHTALLKLCAQLRPEQLEPSVEIFVDCDVTDTAEWLGRHGLHHARALLLRQHGRLPLALDVWKRLVDQELVDVTFPGLQFLVNCLCQYADLDIVWKHTDWLMKKDEQLAVELFTQRSPSLSEQPDTDAVVTYLSRFGSGPLTAYLEWLVNDRQIKLEKYHTHLALLYLEDVLTAKANNKSDNSTVTLARSKLQSFLQHSSLYLTSPLLAKVKDADLYKEAALLHGKAGDHETALRILVHRLQDVRGAEEFCHELSRDSDPAYKRRIFHTLLEVYLDPKSPQPEVLMHSAIALLNSQVIDMDCSKVIRMLPGNWGVNVVRPFLTKAVVDCSQRCRQAKVVKALSRAENLQLLEDSMAAKRRSVLLLEDRQCAVCGDAFTEPSCARYPNGVVVHVKCAKLHRHRP